MLIYEPGGDTQEGSRKGLASGGRTLQPGDQFPGRALRGDACEFSYCCDWHPISYD